MGDIVINPKKVPIIIIFILLILKVSSQTYQPPLPPFDFDYSPTHFLLRVIFHQPTSKPDSWIVIRKDDDSGDISGTTSTVAWNMEEEKNPIGYVSGCKGRVESQFFIECTNPIVKIRGDGSGDFDLPDLEIINTGGVLTYIGDFAKTFTYKEVKYWESFEIKWYLTRSPEEPEELIGTSSNPLYITHKKALAVDPAFKPFYTVLHLGCKNAFDNVIEATIVDKVYFEFEDRMVRKIEGTVDMTYWGPGDAPEPACWYTYGLLRYEDGRCGTWAAFFHDLLSMQGIPSLVSEVNWGYILSISDASTLLTKRSSFFGDEASTAYIYPDYDEIGYHAQFLVKNWTGLADNTFYLSEDDETGVTSITIANGNMIYNSEAIGLAGQGNINPRSEFNNHAIVKYSDKYFDPSYGSPKSDNANSWETSSLDGFSGKLQFHQTVGGVVKVYELIWLGHINTSSLQATITP
jgi:hypothetical protein